jgi:hypothetical protein
MVASYTAGLGDHHLDVPLTGDALRIKRLEHAVATVPMKQDLFDQNAHCGSVHSLDMTDALLTRTGPQTS